MHYAVGLDGQVETVPALAQVAQSGTEPDPIVVVGDGRAYTRSVRAIVVRAIWEAGGPAGIVEGLLGRMPLIPSGVMDKYRPVFSMIVIMIINVGLDLSKIGQDLLEAPLVVAASGPALKVIGNPTVEG
jgi:hypothetical protein